MVISSIFSPTLVRRMIGGIALAGGVGVANYYKTDTVRDRFDTLVFTMKVLKNSGMSFPTLFTSLLHGNTSVSPGSLTELGYDTWLIDYLWRNPSESHLELIESICRESSPRVVCKIISRCPKISLLRNFKIDAFKLQYFQDNVNMDISDFLDFCHNSISIDSSLFIYYLSLNSVEETFDDKVLELISKKVGECENRQIVLKICQKHPIFLPLILDIIQNDSFDESFINDVIHIIESSESVDPKYFENFIKHPQLYDLASELAKKTKIDISKCISLIEKYFEKPSNSLLKLLKTITFKFVDDEDNVKQILQIVLTNLESIACVTDYDSDQIKKSILSNFNRPIVDSELFAFHDDEEYISKSLDSIETIIEKIGIISEILRTTDNTLVFDFLLSVVYPLIASPPSGGVTIKTCANLVCLAPFATKRIRDELVLQNFPISDPKDILSIAHLRRLKHNLKCLHIPSSPMLIDSLLPLSENNPIQGDVDIVFVHGLRGNLNTWRVISRKNEANKPQKIGECTALWPELCLRPKDRLLAFTFDAPLWYATHKQHYSEIDLLQNFEEMGKSLSIALKEAKVGNNVVFIAFSMGGLVVKQALVDDVELREKCKGIVFIATPHLGSPIADYAYFAGSLVSPFVASLSRKAKQVDTLHEKFEHLSIKTMSICETAPTDLGSGIKAVVVPIDTCGACKNTQLIMAPESTDHDDVSKINQDLMQNDPRIIAILQFLNTI